MPNSPKRGRTANATPKRRRRREAPQGKKDKRPPGYKVLGISIYEKESVWIDRITELLRTAGKPRANRSMVIREAILRLQQEIQSETPQDVLRYFNERESARLLKS